MLWQWLNSGKQVFILDLDGTLIPTAKVDNECFWQAVYDCFGERPGLPDLHVFKHVTDSAMLDEWCHHELGRSPTEPETRHIKQRFWELLKSASKHEPQHFMPLPGVRNWLEAIQKKPSVFAGIATGGWEHSARLKLQLAGLDHFNLPLASSDDAKARTEIMQIAAQRTLNHQAGDKAVFTYVGDRAWDLEASQKLHWAFVGIASGNEAVKLRQAGAVHIQIDFRKP
jgi:phosphoglycolate phosphatase-like HAD superfamily hydrolase